MFILNEITMNCGATSLTIDSMLPQLVTTAVNLIKIGIPILLIIFVWIALSILSKSNAATASISASKTTATVGDKVTVSC